MWFIENKLGRSSLLYLWTCTIPSMIAAASPCNLPSLTPAVAARSILSLPGYALTIGTTYDFSVKVYSADGRSAVQTVEMTALLAGSPTVLSLNTIVKFSADKKVTMMRFKYQPRVAPFFTACLSHIVFFFLINF